MGLDDTARLKQLSEIMQDANKVRVTSPAIAKNLKSHNRDVNIEFYKIAEHSGDQHEQPTAKFFGDAPVR